MTTKKLDGLLAADMYATDGEYALYYDISAMQNLKKWFGKEKINKIWMDKLVQGVRTALWTLEQYLLEGKNLLADPEYVFVHMESENIHFVYFPYYIEENQQDMEKFLSFLIEHADEKEADTVEVLYDMYARWEAGREQFSWDTFVFMWDKYCQSLEEIEIPLLEKAVPEKVQMENEQKKLQDSVRWSMEGETLRHDLNNHLFCILHICRAAVIHILIFRKQCGTVCKSCRSLEDSVFLHIVHALRYTCG